MKILYSKHCDKGQDYLADSTFHGLKSIPGIEVIDSPRMWYMYQNDFGPGKNSLSNLYGRGFTYYATIPDDSNIDRSDIEGKIKNKYFDLIIFSRLDAWHLSPYVDLVLEHYPPSKVIFLDGEDGIFIQDRFLGKGTYFKRELTVDNRSINPVSFGFPEEKIQPLIEKTQAISNNIPSGRSHNEENTYYQEYARSCFGKTKKKSGWDCLRHYEILGSRSIPWFEDIRSCPERICTTLPKSLLVQVLDLINQKSPDWFLNGVGKEKYLELENLVYNHFIRHCTTKAVATYMLDTHLKQTYD